MSSKPKYKPNPNSWHFLSLKFVCGGLRPVTQCGYWLASCLSALLIVTIAGLITTFLLYPWSGLMGLSGIGRGCADSGACSKGEALVATGSIMLQLIMAACAIGFGINHLVRTGTTQVLWNAITQVFSLIGLFMRYTLVPLVFALSWAIVQPFILIRYLRDRLFDAFCPGEMEYDDVPQSNSELAQ